MNINACLSSKSDEWRTPSKLFNYFMENGFFDLFPFGSSKNQYDILYKEQRLFINPPYSHLNKVYFLDYLRRLYEEDNIIALLIPSRTDTRFFNAIQPYISYVVFFKGRLHFNDDSKCAPFPSMLIIMDYNAIRLPYPFFISISVDDFILHNWFPV